MSRSARRLTIAIVSDAIHPYHKGGKEMRLHHLATGLAKLGHDVHIYTMKWWDGPRDRVENGIHLHAITKYRPLYHGRRRSISQAIWFSLAIPRLLSAKFDLLEVDHMPYFPLFTGKLVAILKRRPLYATWHEVWGGGYWRQYLGKLGLVAAAIERLTGYLPDHIIAVSPLTAKRVRSVLRSPRPISIVPNGIELSMIASITPAKTTTDIIFTGRLLAHKNVDLLLRAVAILRASRPKLRCTIVGDGPERSRLEHLAAELGLAGIVTFTGYVEQDADVLALMKAARVFVLPSTREGFGIVALEAMACGLPVVAVDHPDNATRHLITPTTGRVAKVNAASLAANIAEMLDVAPAPAELQAAAGRYDWQTATHKLLTEYSS